MENIPAYEIITFYYNIVCSAYGENINKYC